MIQTWTRRRIGALLPLAALLLSACAGGSLSRGGEPGRESLQHGGRERTYLLRVPPLAPADRALPLVIVLHGGGGDGANAERMTGFTGIGRREGFLVAYPDGTGRTRLRTWNAGHCCGFAMENEVDDVGFISALIDRISANYRIDPRRIYVTGMSNGAMMTHRIGLELPGRIAAIAPVAGAIFGDEIPPRDPPAALMINGMLDRSVPYEGGPAGGAFPSAWDGTSVRPAVEQAAFWARAAGCVPGATPRPGPGYLHHTFDCPMGKPVELYSIEQGGHAWPGGQRGSRRGDAPGNAIEASELIWRFFSRVTR